MALSAHLEGVMNGTFLIAVGAGWGHVELPPRVEKAARWTALYGAYGNWLFTTVGAALGTAAANPIPSQGHHGKTWQETLAGAGFRSIAYSILIAVMLLLWGLAGRKPLQDNAVGFPDKVGDINHYLRRCASHECLRRHAGPMRGSPAAPASALSLEAPSMMVRSSPCYASVRAMVASMARPPLVSRATFR
jgi:hydroxylaminobenzene mutase